MTAPEFEARVLAWARTRPDLEALVQIGSRVQAGAVVDQWSDWDYQMIVRDPAPYCNRDWPAEIAPCWSAHFERTERKVTKLSAVFAGGHEIDFVLLAAWQMKVVCWAMRHPGARTWFPRALSEGVQNLQLIARPGYRVVLGGPEWERRYAALAEPWPERFFTAEEFERQTAAFWRHAVWVGKKTMRGELRAAIRWHQREVRELLYALLAEEARVAGRMPRPEARQAERWLDPERLRQTAHEISLEQGILARALLADLALFQEVSASVAASRGFPLADYRPLHHWLRTELAKISGS